MNQLYPRLLCCLLSGILLFTIYSLRPPLVTHESELEAKRFREFGAGEGFVDKFESFHELREFLIIDDLYGAGSRLDCSNIPFLSVVVFSSPSNFDKREAIRNTWAFKTGSIFSVHFLIGVKDMKKPVMTRLEEESRLNNDILLAEFVDSYSNLTLKSLSMLLWTNNTSAQRLKMQCRVQSGFLLKADDDTFVNIEEIVNVLRILRLQPLALGSIISGTGPLPGANWKYLNLDYPDYLSGSAYVLSIKAVEKILEIVDEVAPYSVEDVYITGILTKLAGVPVLHNNKFRPFSSEFNPCLKQISSHKVSPKRMAMLQKILLNSDKHCRFVKHNDVY